MRQFWFSFFFLTATNFLCAEEARVLYYDFFGEYFNGEEFNIQVDPSKDNIPSLLNQLKKKCKSGLETDLLLIAYGDDAPVDAFFAATKRLENQAPLNEVLPRMPETRPEANGISSL